MKLTALEIRKHEFVRGFRGYNPEEVDAFLQMVAQQWQQLSDEYKVLEQKLEERSSQLDQFRREEHALRELLQTAREGAQRRLDEAHTQADSMLEDADIRAGRRLDEAEQRAVDIVRAAEVERQMTRRESSRISVRRNEIIARLRAFLSSELEVLARYEGDEADYAADDASLDAIGVVAAVPAVPEPPVPVVAPVEEAPVEEAPIEEAPTDDLPVDAAPMDDLPVDAAPIEEVPVEDEPVADPEQVDEAKTTDQPADDHPEPPLADESADEPSTDGESGDAPPRPEDVATPGEETATEAIPEIFEAPEPARAKRRNQPGRQGDLMTDADGDDASGATEEIRKIRRILEDLDR